MYITHDISVSEQLDSISQAVQRCLNAIILNYTCLNAVLYSETGNTYIFISLNHSLHYMTITRISYNAISSPTTKNKSKPILHNIILAVLLRCTHYYDLISFHGVPYDDAFNLLVEPLYAVPKSWRCGLRDGDGNQDGFRHLRLRGKKVQHFFRNVCMGLKYTNIPLQGKAAFCVILLERLPHTVSPHTHTYTISAVSPLPKIKHSARLSSIIIHKPLTTENITIESPLLLSLRVLFFEYGVM